jgi:hypothetical protein
MNNPKVEAMVRRIKEKTSEGQLQWEETEAEGVYQTAFTSYSVQVSLEDSREAQGTDVVLRIFNSEGKMIEEVRDPDLVGDKYDSPKAFKEMRELYDTARRYAMGVEQALDQILKDLDDKDEIPF